MWEEAKTLKEETAQRMLEGYTENRVGGHETKDKARNMRANL